jgi:hypothetical protein
VFIAGPADSFPSAGSDARSELPILPKHACAKSDGSAEQAEGESPGSRMVVGFPGCRPGRPETLPPLGSERIPGGFAETRGKRLILEYFAFALVRSLERGIHEPPAGT